MPRSGKARLPCRTIQWYLDTVHGLHLSLGAIVDATRKVAGQAQRELAGILERIRGSPVVHADEVAGGRTQRLRVDFQQPDLRYFLRRNRGKAVVDEVLGDEFAGVLVSDFYAAYHHYDGPKQRCWAHLLRDIHDLRVLYPEITDCPSGPMPYINSIAAKAFTRRQSSSGALPNWSWKDASWPSAVPSWMTRRRHKPNCADAWRTTSRNSVFVAHPEVPPDNNAAERSLRPVVISRKVSGGTRSERGTETKMTLASIFGTWRAQGLNPLSACQQLLASPQL